MIGVDFEVQAAVAPSAEARADVACFVGHVARRQTSLPSALVEFLLGEGFPVKPEPTGSPSANDLLDVPVPIDSWDTFDHLFAWERRMLVRPEEARARGWTTSPEHDPSLWTDTYLGAAVRSFFQQGGRRCWVIRVGDPWPYLDPDLDESKRASAVDRIIPGYAGPPANPRDRASLRGAAHVFGLPDVSFVSAPDLVELFSGPPRAPSLLVPPSPPPEHFVECSEPVAAPPLQSHLRFDEPRCLTDRDIAGWASAVSALARIVAQRRDVELVASLPLFGVGTLADRGVLEALTRLNRNRQIDEGGVASAFVQLVWPWLRADSAERLPGRVEPPEGAVAGVLARSVLRQGAFHSAAKQGVFGVRSLEPMLGAEARRRPVEWGTGRATHGLEGHVTLIGPTPRGLELLSDVTTSASLTYRPAAVQRLLSILVRTAQRVGESVAFEPSGERLWSMIRGRMSALLLALWHEGALSGRSVHEAFEVRCDQSTMSQSDIDAGRAICLVEFQPVAPIERIAVVLNVQGGQVSLQAGGAA